MTADRHRTFLAVYPDRDTLARLEAFLGDQAPRFPEIRWSPGHQLHFTLRFFGDLSQAELDKAAQVLETLAPSIAPMTIPLNGVGAFPDWRRPRVFWIGTGAGGEELENAARRLDIAFAEAGLGRADKPFKAHLTIGRLREGRVLERAEFEELRRMPFSAPPFPVAEMKLMLSRLSPKGATHEMYRGVTLGR